MSNPTGTNVNVSMPSQSTLQGTQNPVVTAAQQLRTGEFPSNQTLQQGISSTQAALDQARTQAPLSSKGQVLVEDARQLLDSASLLLTEKNADQRLQRIYANTHSTTRNTASGLSGSNLPLSGQDAAALKPHARGVWDNGRSVAKFAIKSGQFRNILMEVLELFQSLLQSTQQHLAQQPNLGGNSLSNVASGLGNETIVSEEQKQRLYSQLRTLLVQLGQQPEYYNAIDHMFQMVDQMSWKAQQLKNSTNTQALPSTGEVDNIWSDVKLFVEEFSGAGSMQELERRVFNTYQAMNNDPQARLWLQEFRTFVLETIRNPQLVQQREGYGRNLLDQGRILMQGKYRPYFNDIFDQLRMILTNIKNDYVTQDFTTKLQKFGTDFAFDEMGRPDIFVMQDSLNQMKTILMPLISTQLANLPIPKIEGSNAKYDFSVEGMILHVNELIPDFINLKTKTDTTMSVQRLATTKNSTKVVMEIDQIRATFKNMRFFYRRKRMPRIEDHGIADVDLSQGTGISLKLVWRIKSTTNQPMQLRLLKVKCNIDRLAITVRSAKHNIIDKLATKLFAKTIKKQIANAIVNNIISGLTPLNAKLNTLFKARPASGLANRLNDGMKTTLFTGEGQDPSLISRAKDTITSGLGNIKNKKQTTGYINTNPVYNQFDTYSTTPVMPIDTIATENIATENPMTYIERPNREWAFEWYDPNEYVVMQDSTLPQGVDPKLSSNINTNTPMSSI